MSGRIEESGGTARAADRRPRRLVGRPHPAGAQGRGGLPQRALPRPPTRRCGRPRPAQPHAAGGRARHPPRLLRRGSRHRDDEHLYGDLDRPGGLRARGGGLRDELRRGAARPAGGGRARPAGLGSRFHRPAQRLALGLAACRRPDVPVAHVRADRRGVLGADPRARRRRGGPAPDRDDLRHAEREGGHGGCSRCRA